MLWLFIICIFFFNLEKSIFIKFLVIGIMIFWVNFKIFYYFFYYLIDIIKYLSFGKCDLIINMNFMEMSFFV